MDNVGPTNYTDATKQISEKFEIICKECRSIHTSIEIDNDVLIVLCELCENGANINI